MLSRGIGTNPGQSRQGRGKGFARIEGAPLLAAVLGENAHIRMPVIRRAGHRGILCSAIQRAAAY
jgi:hypothetical protein